MGMADITTFPKKLKAQRARLSPRSGRRENSPAIHRWEQSCDWFHESVKRTTESSKNIATIIGDTIRVKKLQKLFFEGLLSVMFFLTVYVAYDALHLRRADAECAVPILPRKLPIARQLIVNPF